MLWVENIRREIYAMIIAATYDNGQVFPHFGHTQAMKLYTVEEGKVVSSQVLSTGAQGHGALAGFLTTHGVEALICGGIGAGAQNALAQAGIKLYAGVSGDCDEAVAALLAGELTYDPEGHCDHHHEEGHECHHGEGGCGEDKHGCAGSGHCG